MTLKFASKLRPAQDTNGRETRQATGRSAGAKPAKKCSAMGTEERWGACLQQGAATVKFIFDAIGLRKLYVGVQARIPPIHLSPTIQASREHRICAGLTLARTTEVRLFLFSETRAQSQLTETPDVER